MGCDIHFVIERREPGSAEWVGVYSSDNDPGGYHTLAQRDYGFFTEVANVRGRSSTGVYPRNLPKDVSRLAWLQYMRCPTDYHSVSHMTPEEFVGAWLRANPGGKARGRENPVRPDYATYDLLRLEADPERGEHRIVFWFDN